MSLGSSSLEFSAIEQLLLSWLQAAIASLNQRPPLSPTLSSGNRGSEDGSSPSFIPTGDVGDRRLEKNEVQADNLVLHQVKDETQLLYVSPLALKLSKSWLIPSVEIATEIAAHLTYSAQTLADDPRQYFTLQVVPPGWIQWQLNDLGVATWLQRLAQAPLGVQGCGGAEVQGSRGAEVQGSRGAEVQENSLSPFPHTRHPTPDTRHPTPDSQFPSPSPPSLSLSSPSVFSVQYAHARCCSLLRLAHREGMVTLNEPNPQRSPYFFCAIAPKPIPWLTEAGQLRLVHPAERSLIYHLFAGLDAVYCPSPKQNRVAWEKLASNISLSFEKFYSQCRIWGEVKRETPELSQARLGLLMATQALLRLLLEDLLSEQAPLEL